MMIIIIIIMMMLLMVSVVWNLDTLWRLAETA
jgi:hypothetical protein